MKEALDFLRDERLCVVATVDSNGQPESALVAFSENTNLEILIGTSKKSRKYLNLSKNPNVSIVFGFGGKKTLQYEGVAYTPTEKELEVRLKQHFIKQPGSIKYQNDPNQTYFVVKPRCIRITASGLVILKEVRF